jgi:PKD repeat protein
LVAGATPLFAQKYPMPGKKNQPVVKCTGCGGANEGKPTYPYNDPLVAFVGRYVDSTDINNYQNIGIRTIRANKVRVSPDGQRLYLGLGEAVGGYNLNKFFTTTLKQPLMSASSLPVGQDAGWAYRPEIEKVQKVDSLFYVESPFSGWTISTLDTQRMLNDFDSDDRGYVYAASLHFGWGISQDKQDGSHMVYVENIRTTNPSAIFGIKTGGKYYVVPSTTDTSPPTLDIYEFNAPNVTKVVTRSGNAHGIVEWAKYERGQRLAILSMDGRVRVYDYASFISGAAPLADVAPASGRRFVDVTIDETGRVWIAEDGEPNKANQLYRLLPSGNGYSQQALNVYGGPFSPAKLHAAGGYIAVIGRDNTGKDLALLKLDGGTPKILDTDHFFQKYYDYFSSIKPAGHATPEWRYTAPTDVGIVENGNKTYLIAAFGGLGDVFEIEAGEALSISVAPPPFGTANPNAPANTSGTPFYGDVVKFSATSNNSSATYGVNWDFGNPDSGLTGNLASSALGAQVSHQYTGITSATSVAAPKTVTAQASTDGSIASTYSVSLAVPTARMLVPGRATAMTATTRSAFDAVPGESFRDASDGVVEGHVAAWIIDGVETRKAPSEPMPVGTTLGAHTVTLESRYGKPNALNVTNPFVASVSGVSYTLKPFVATMAPARSSGNSYIFEATGRFTTDKQLLNTTQWTVTWTATGASATTVDASQTNTVALGTIPPFEIAKSAAGNGTVIKLQISVDAAAVPAPAYASYSAQQTLLIPDPLVQITSGCTNASEVCTLTAASKTGVSTAAWNIEWNITQGGTSVKTGTGLTISFTPSAAGTYTATATEKLFNQSDTRNLPVAPSACGPVAEEHMAAVSTDCGFDCKANVSIQFDPNIKPGYKVQPCDELIWDFGDQTPTVKQRSPSHTYTRNGTYRVTFTMKNNTNQRTWSKDVVIGGGAPPIEQPVTCTIPVNPMISYSGSKGCGPSKPCTTSESVTFTASRGLGGLQSCDVTTWTFDGSEQSTSRSPRKTFTTAGTHNVALVLSNTTGSAAPVSVQLQIVNDGQPNCNGSAAAANLGVEYHGPESGCSQLDKTKPCKVGENIQFTLTSFGYTIQACDVISWSFGDNTTGTGRNVQHAYSTLAATRAVAVTVSNPNNTTGATASVSVPFGNVPVLVVPQLEFVGFPSRAAKGTTVTFTARVKNDVDATGWTWNFGDNSTDTSKVTLVGRTVSVTHTYATTGSFNVSVRARHAQAGSGAETGTAIGTITIDDTPEYKYLLPVVVSSPGQNNSTWRTDVQIYTPDSTVSNTNKLSMTASMRDIVRTLDITKSTTIYEDFMKTFSGDKPDSGAVIITVKTRLAPQIWTRTYNQAANGTFGQFIPAIRIDAAGGGAAFGEGKYFLAGLRHDARYRTNLGFLNPNAQVIAATVRVYDDTGLQIGAFNRTLQPFQLDQFPITAALPSLKGNRPFSVEIEVPTGQWVIGYASYIDGNSNDPVFIQAIRESELSSPDYRTSIVPGVGRIGPWRSDVTIYNPNGRGIMVDLAYFNQAGEKVAETTSVPVGGGEFLQYDDLLKSGIFGSISAESLGMLRVTVPATITEQQFPMALARTYNDDGSGKTYGQGIGGFAVARANVKPSKPALIPGIRSIKGKYYTNFGVTNVSSTDAVVTVKVLDPSTGAETPIQQHTVKANQSLVQRVDLGTFETASLKVEVTGGNVWAFASIVDEGTKDPEYVAALPLQ